MTPVDIGIFAHNEAETIGNMIGDLLSQDLVVSPQNDVVIHVLANGCTDDTVEAARSAVTEHGLQDRFMVHDLPDGGKSRTWNRFVHDLSRRESEYLMFIDADIRITDPNVLRGLVELVSASKNLDGAVSRPVKDIVHDPRLKRGPLDSLIANAGGTLNDWRASLTGGLYVLRASVARSFHIPIGLPTEDGFVGAMVKTRNFENEKTPEKRLDGREEFFFIYESERHVGALIHHQTRLVVGGAVNATIFGRLRSLSLAERQQELAQSAQDPEWLPTLLSHNLPRMPYGYVPFGFLIKRVLFWKKSTKRFHPKRMALVLVGFAFDVIVYIRAQYIMWRGAAAGYW